MPDGRSTELAWTPVEGGGWRLNFAPVSDLPDTLQGAHRPDVLPPTWDQRTPFFPINLRFYVAVQRAEVAHLARHARMFHLLTADGEPPPEAWSELLTIPFDVWKHAYAILAYRHMWVSIAENDRPSGMHGLDLLGFHWSVEGLIPILETLFREHDPAPFLELVRQASPDEILRYLQETDSTPLFEFARRASTPAMLKKYGLMLARAPGLWIDYRAIPPMPGSDQPEPDVIALPEAPAAGPEPAATPEASEPPLPPLTANSVESRAISEVIRRDKHGLDLSVSDIARTLGCDRSYLYSLPQFRALLEAAKAARQGKRPRGRKGADESIEAWADDD